MPRLKTNFWAKGQRTVSDKYRKNYDITFGKKDNKSPEGADKKSQSPGDND